MPLLTLDPGRVVAYHQDGDPQSNDVLLFFAGIFSIGSIKHTFPIVKEKGLHHVSFTLPGWGDASPVPPSSTFAETLIGDITALFDHLYTDKSNLKIYVAGGSFGTVPAQVIYGAPFDVFPLGRNVAGLMLLAPFSPFRIHTDYAKSLSWRDWVGVGPLTKYLPISSLLSLAMGSKFKSVDSAEQMLRQILFDKMDETEKEKLEAHCQKLGTTPDKFVKTWAEESMKSVENGWEGYKQVAVALHSDWGFTFPLDDEHARGKVLIKAANNDGLGSGMAKYLAQNYANAEFVTCEGGHISGIYTLNEDIARLIS
ncbi:hypothetical protein BJ322DRAFT_1073122 [Thelephora terrestris]|uniref:AB hydrolase-1 domain-containing protein n=1 Tax=Thelephora terrestris TaxID=56493 RepID=A0A9P6HDC7_9AGAM|nr:hypothetical protein BJ322DRAFT_1073122 [Thelephora terrestris]